MEEKLRAEIDDKNRQLQTLVNGLATENIEVKNRIVKTENEIAEVKKLLEKLVS